MRRFPWIAVILRIDYCDINATRIFLLNLSLLFLFGSENHVMSHAVAFIYLLHIFIHWHLIFYRICNCISTRILQVPTFLHIKFQPSPVSITFNKPYTPVTCNKKCVTCEPSGAASTGVMQSVLLTCARLKGSLLPCKTINICNRIYQLFLVNNVNLHFLGIISVVM